MASIFKGLLIVTIALQLLVALTQSGWVKSIAELCAFLLVIVLSLTIKQQKQANSTTSPISPPTD